MSKTIFIGGRLESKEKGNVVAGANAILDDTKGKKQNVINKETDDELLRLEQSKQDNLTFDNAPTEDSTNPVTSGGVYTAEKALSDAIEAILLLIPSAATALNKLVDTNTMNSSISTATATFRGTYNAVTDLGLTYQATHAQIEAALDALGLTADNNDYAFVQIPVSDQSQDIAKTERYKNNGTNWQYEYDLNTSGFTAAQWGAINSTITLALVQKLAALPTNAELLQALGLKQDVLTFDNAPTTDSNNPVKSGGIKNAIDTAVGDEATARENADTALGGLIGDEQTRAEDVEGGLNNRLGAVEGSVTTIQGVIPSEATSSNKLVDNNSMTTYISTIIDNIDATFNMTSTDGHVTLAITQVNGVITSVQLATSDIASAAALNLKASQADLTALAGRVTTAEGNITSLTGRMTTAEGDIDQLLALYNALQQSAPQVIEPTDTWPVANPSTTVIYRVIDRVNTPPEYYSDYMWNGSTWVLMATYNNAIDDYPTYASDNLVKSGGVFDKVAHIGSNQIDGTLKLGSLEIYPQFIDGEYKTSSGTSISTVTNASYSTIVIDDVFVGQVFDLKLDSLVGQNYWKNYFIFAKDDTTSAIDVSDIADYVDEIDSANYIYRLTVPNGTTKIYSTCLKNQKGVISVTGFTNVKSLKWLNVEPEQIDGTEHTFESSAITPTFTDGGYKSEGSDKVISSVVSGTMSLITIDNVNFGEVYDFNLLGTIGEQYWKNYFIFAKTDNEASISVGEIADYVKVLDETNGIYRLMIPQNTAKIFSSCNISEKSNISVSKVVSKKSLCWLKVKRENLGEDSITYIENLFNELLNTKKEIDLRYHLYESIKKPIEFSGKSLVAFGDSITYGQTHNQGTYTQNSYIKLFCDYAGVSVLDNQAVPGTTISYRESNDIYSKILNYNGDADIIWIAGGINDWSFSCPLGVFGDTDNTTVYGALKGICEYLTNNYPNATVIFVTPLSVTTPEERWSTIAPLDAYRTAIYDVATYYGFNVVNGLGLGMPQRQGAWSDLIIADTCHPTEIGHALYARNLCGKLL